jgi:DNA-3-methyladenine glycosylase II
MYPIVSMCLPMTEIEAYLSEKDAVLKQIIANTPQYKKGFDAGTDVYISLLESIVSQQISVRAADTIFARFCALFPQGYPTPLLLIEATEDELRSAGLSFQKIKYLKSVATFTLINPIDYDFLQNMTDEEIVQYLLPIKGVGRWTVEMILMFTLNRPDIFPIDDLIIRQKMLKAYSIISEGKQQRTELTAIAEKWKPYRSIVCRYLWRWKGDN